MTFLGVIILLASNSVSYISWPRRHSIGLMGAWECYGSGAESFSSRVVIDRMSQWVA